MIVTMMLGLIALLRLCPDLPVSRAIAHWVVDVPARRLNRTSPAQWGMMIGMGLLIGLAWWFEMDEIRMLATSGGTLADALTLTSSLEWGGLVELSVAALVSRSFLGRLPFVARLARPILRRQARHHRAAPSAAANDDDGDSDGRLAA